MPQLTINFCGLFLYVQDGDPLIVLAPKTGQNEFGAVENHVAQLIVPTSPLRRYDIGGFDVEIRHSGPFASLPSLPGELAKIRAATSHAVPSLVLNEPLTNEGPVFARIRATKGRAQPLGHTPPSFRFASPVDQPLTHAFTWRMPVAAPLVLALRDVSGTSSSITIDPVNGADYEIVVAHIPASQLGGGHSHPIVRGKAAHDFAALYSLYGENVGSMPIPVVSPNVTMATSAHASPLTPLFMKTLGGDPVTCVGGEG